MIGNRTGRHIDWLVCALLACATLARPAAADPGPAALAPVWVYPSTGTIAPVVSSPTVYDGVVFAGDDAGRLHAIRATGPDAGTPLPGWPLQLEGAIRGRPAVYGNKGLERLYVATTAGLLYAFRLDGVPAWTTNPQVVSPDTPIESTPAVRGPYVYVTTSDGRLLRRHSSDGRAAGGIMYGRTAQTRLASSHSARLGRSYLEVEDASGFFPTGRIRIITSDVLGEPVSTSFTYSAVNTAVRPHRLLNLSPVGDGQPLAILPERSPVIGLGPGVTSNLSPAVPGSDDATLIITALGGTAPAGPFTPADRNLVGLRSEPFGLLPQWETSCGTHLTTAPLVDHRSGLLYVGSKDDAGKGYLHALHASNGQPSARWQNGHPLEIRGALGSGPWLDSARERILFGTTAGFLYAVSARDGTMAAPPVRLPGAGGFFASPVVAGNRLYLGSSTGRFYSVPLEDPASARVYVSPDGKPFDSSPSASGSAAGQDVVVVGSSAGRILAFPVE